MKVTVALVAIRTIMETTETFGSREEYKSSGLHGWPLRRTIRRWTLTRPMSTVLDFLFDYPRYLILVGIELACAAGLLLTEWKKVYLPLILALIVFQLLSRMRNGAYGGEGSDQMHFLLLTASAVYFSVSDPFAKTLAVWFIALQAMLAYITAGLVKLRSGLWRQGTAIALVLNCETYGNKFSASLMKRTPYISRFLCWSTIVFECSFPVLLLCGIKPALLVLAGGAFFHLMIAMCMAGFNGFFWAFVATYPSLWYVAVMFHNLVAPYRH